MRAIKCANCCRCINKKSYLFTISKLINIAFYKIFGLFILHPVFLASIQSINCGLSYQKLWKRSLQIGSKKQQHQTWKAITKWFDWTALIGNLICSPFLLESRDNKSLCSNLVWINSTVAEGWSKNTHFMHGVSQARKSCDKTRILAIAINPIWPLVLQLIF